MKPRAVPIIWFVKRGRFRVIGKTHINKRPTLGFMHKVGRVLGLTDATLLYFV